ncbi:hypothetical protein [Bradyrhizobium sp. 17]|nr:hypothetical protein [Bradyrhizobium sp. 17]
MTIAKMNAITVATHLEHRFSKQNCDDLNARNISAITNRVFVGVI